jgi:outer membrane protein
MKWFLLALILPNILRAADTEENLPLWEYGIGVGTAYFEDYPASNEHRFWTLPFPTFQYRGKILRADDREGAKAYLVHKPTWSLEMGGGGIVALKSENNEARSGMDDIPWGIHLGPRFVTHLSENIEFKLGLYAAINTDFRFTKLNGATADMKLIWIIDEILDDYFQIGKSKGRFSFGVDTGSQDFLATYFEVSKNDARSDRPQYEARAGALSYEFSYLQAINIRPWGVYAGVTSVHYDISANRESPLHKSDRNLKGFVGITYVLGESVRRAIPESEAEGAIDKLKDKLKEKLKKD